MHPLGFAREIVALDLSPKVLEFARRTAAGIGSIRYVLGSLDAIVGVGSMYHCARLDRLHEAIVSLLAPRGLFYLDEYVGPDRFQYSSTHNRQVTVLAKLLPDWPLTMVSGTVSGRSYGH